MIYILDNDKVKPLSSPCSQRKITRGWMWRASLLVQKCWLPGKFSDLWSSALQKNDQYTAILLFSLWGSKKSLSAAEAQRRCEAKADCSGRWRWSIQLSHCQSTFSILDSLRNPLEKGMVNTLVFLKYFSVSITYRHLYQKSIWGNFALFLIQFNLHRCCIRPLFQCLSESLTDTHKAVLCDNS